jgi:hypothetical protein
MNIWVCKSCKGTNVSQNAHINPNHLNKYGGTLIHDEDIAWEDEMYCGNDLPYDKRARYLQDLLLQKIEYGLQSIDDCIEILFTDDFSDLIPKNFEDYEHEDCIKFINNFIKKEQD